MTTAALTILRDSPRNAARAIMRLAWLGIRSHGLTRSEAMVCARAAWAKWLEIRAEEEREDDERRAVFFIAAKKAAKGKRFRKRMRSAGVITPMKHAALTAVSNEGSVLGNGCGFEAHTPEPKAA